MRDTDRDWEDIGRHEPFHGVLSAPRFLRDQMTDSDLADFWQSGVMDIDHVLRTARHHLGDFVLDEAIDFGCGVGRLTRAMARHCVHVIGVDISSGMREIARQYAPENVNVVGAIPDQMVNWVNSSIVFQHIPPQRRYLLFAELIGRVAPGGVFTIHVTFFKDRAYLDGMLRGFTHASWDGETLDHVQHEAMREGTMLMYDYDLNKLLMSATIIGFERIYMDHINHGGCHGLMMYGRRSPCASAYSALSAS